MLLAIRASKIFINQPGIIKSLNYASPIPFFSITLKTHFLM